MKQIRIFFCIFAKNISKCRLLLEKKESISLRGYAWSEEYRVAAKLVIITTECTDEKDD